MSYTKDGGLGGGPYYFERTTDNSSFYIERKHMSGYLQNLQKPSEQIQDPAQGLETISNAFSQVATATEIVGPLIKTGGNFSTGLSVVSGVTAVAAQKTPAQRKREAYILDSRGL